MSLIDAIDNGFKRVATLLKTKADKSELDSIKADIKELKKATGIAIIDDAITVDFVTQSYKNGNDTLSFDDVFDFKRASKAWLVTTAGLKEFDNDIARITNDGLLIEQQATNYITHSNYPALYGVKGGDWVELNTSKLIGKAVLLKPAQTYVYALTNNLPMNADIYASYYVETSNPEPTLGYNTSSDFAVQGMRHLNLATTDKLGNMLKIHGVARKKSSDNGYYTGLIKYTHQASTPDVTLHGVQLEDGNHATSFIITKDTPVTRQADTLKLKNTATAVTGDWDDTLELSITDGQLVHSGYGYIRQLEIN